MVNSLCGTWMITAPIGMRLNALSPASEIVWEGLDNTEMHYILFDFSFLWEKEKLVLQKK